MGEPPLSKIDEMRAVAEAEEKRRNLELELRARAKIAEALEKSDHGMDAAFRRTHRVELKRIFVGVN